MPTQFTILCQETTLYNSWNIVKEKGSAGGIDGVSIQEFEKDKRRQIPRLAEELTNKTWKPYPYLEIEITKDKSQDEKRKIGMTAIRYWDYMRELIADDDVALEHREHQGATDLTNSMLNYGYAILYTRVWQALLAARLNPFDSLIHVRQEGKPTLAYDLIEIFRSHVVDRIVISLIQKGQELEVRNGLLTDKTRQLLVKSIMERLARYEKYQGEEMKMENIILRQTKLLAKAFEGTEKFKPYVAKW